MCQDRASTKAEELFDSTVKMCISDRTKEIHHQCLIHIGLFYNNMHGQQHCTNHKSPMGPLLRHF